MHALKTLLTGKDNSSFDIGRVLWGLSTVVYLFLVVCAAFVKGLAFDPMAVAGGLAAIHVGAGASLRVKDGTEPEPEAK